MWQNPQETVDLVTFTEEILSGKLHFFVAPIVSLLLTKIIPIVTNTHAHTHTHTHTHTHKQIRE